MRVNNVVANMRGGKMSYGCNLSFPSSTLAELAGRVGFDFVTFDSEHGPFTPDLLDDLCRFADMAEVEMEDGTVQRMIHCRRLDCDNWDYSSAEPAKSVRTENDAA